MAARARPGGPDLSRLLARGAGDGLARFPDSTQMGVWTFPSHVVDSLSYEELVPIGPCRSNRVALPVATPDVP